MTVQQASRLGKSDFEQLQFAATSDRVLFTFDKDFLKLAASGEPHAGIVWCPARKFSIGEIIRRLPLISAVLTPDEMRNQVEYL